MRAKVFDNTLFDGWLNKKSDEILSKVDKEAITTEEMIVLVLRGQTNHFHHMDQEFRQEFNNIKQEFVQVRQEFNQRFEQVDHRFGQIDKNFEQVDKRFEQVDKRFEQVDKRFDQMDKKFDRMGQIMMWQGGLALALFSGLYLKLFLG